MLLDHVGRVQFIVPTIRIEILPFDPQGGSDFVNWLRHMQRDGAVTLTFVDPQNMFRWAGVQGRLVEVVEDPGGDQTQPPAAPLFLAETILARERIGSR